MKKLFSEIPYIKGKTIVMREIRQEDAPGLKELTESETVYRYLPTFLFEKKYDDVSDVISRLYDECLEESLILGIFMDDRFCGLEELYGYRDDLHKISIGSRLMEWCWGKGVASEALELIVDYLLNETDIEIITASSMVENKASARVLSSHGFERVAHDVPEDWGFEKPRQVDKWIR